MAETMAIQTPRTFQAQAVLVGTGIVRGSISGSDRVWRRVVIVGAKRVEGRAASAGQSRCQTTGFLRVSMTSPSRAPGHHWSRSLACTALSEGASRIAASM